SSLRHLITVEGTLLRSSGCILYKPPTLTTLPASLAMQSIKSCGYKPKHDAEHRNEITMHSISNVRYKSERKNKQTNDIRPKWNLNSITFLDADVDENENENEDEDEAKANACIALESIKRNSRVKLRAKQTISNESKIDLT
uniref:Uncharacterized protein n=1 Tax=Glossina palpalis gambiensis TaxID=67801 RepID=A0A1B0BBI8_9MUSC